MSQSAYQTGISRSSTGYEVFGVSIAPETITIGQCYLTRSGQVRRVRAITEGRVLFDSRRRSPKGPRWIWYPSILDLQVFAAAAERPIPEDWTSEADKP